MTSQYLQLAHLISSLSDTCWLLLSQSAVAWLNFVKYKSYQQLLLPVHQHHHLQSSMVTERLGMLLPLLSIESMYHQSNVAVQDVLTLDNLASRINSHKHCSLGIALVSPVAQSEIVSPLQNITWVVSRVVCLDKRVTITKIPRERHVAAAILSKGCLLSSSHSQT
jgi:hypothetical protein